MNFLKAELNPDLKPDASPLPNPPSPIPNLKNKKINRTHIDVRQVNLKLPWPKPELKPSANPETNSAASPLFAKLLKCGPFKVKFITLKFFQFFIFEEVEF